MEDDIGMKTMAEASHVSYSYYQYLEPSPIPPGVSHLSLISLHPYTASTSLHEL